MTTQSKLFCPHCGRCLGSSICEENAGVCKVLTDKPKKYKKTQMIHLVKCSKCKNELYVSMEIAQ